MNQNYFIGLLNLNLTTTRVSHNAELVRQLTMKVKASDDS